MSQDRRRFTPEYRLTVVKRMLNGESVSGIQHELGIKRSILYRWRDTYRKEGEAGLERSVGRPPGDGVPKPPPETTGEERLRQQVRELECKVGQQAMLLDFFRGAFKRVKEQMPGKGGNGAKPSTPRSGQ